MKDFEPKAGNRLSLAAQETDILLNKVLPTARRWTQEYPEGTPLWRHGKQTLEYWGEAL